MEDKARMLNLPDRSGLKQAAQVLDAPQDKRNAAAAEGVARRKQRRLLEGVTARSSTRGDSAAEDEYRELFDEAVEDME